LLKGQRFDVLVPRFGEESLRYQLNESQVPGVSECALND
jgi:hypothetical protein